MSEPTFSKDGIRFTLRDTRPNTMIYITVKIGRHEADKGIVSKIKLGSATPGTVFISFKECKYSDSGIDALATATKFEVTIGAKLRENDKTVYTKFDVPISEFRRALLDSAE